MIQWQTTKSETDTASIVRHPHEYQVTGLLQIVEDLGPGHTYSLVGDSFSVSPHGHRLVDSRFSVVSLIPLALTFLSPTLFICYWI